MISCSGNFSVFVRLPLPGGFSFPFPLAAVACVVVAPRAGRPDPALLDARVTRPLFSFSLSPAFSLADHVFRLASAASHWLRETLRVLGMAMAWFLFVRRYVVVA